MHLACSWLVKVILCPLLDCANIPRHELEPSISGFLMIPLSLKVSAPSPDSQASLPWIQTSGNFPLGCLFSSGTYWEVSRGWTRWSHIDGVSKWYTFKWEASKCSRITRISSNRRSGAWWQNLKAIALMCITISTVTVNHWETSCHDHLDSND